MVKAGFYGKTNRVQRWKCQQCGRRFADAQEKLFHGETRLPKEKVLLILHLLVEGNSIRSAARIADVEKRTVMNLMVRAGEHCERLLESHIRNVEVKDVQCDEIWTFVNVKEGHLRPKHDSRVMGDAYTFIGIERHSKLILAWHLGKRDQIATDDFISKLRTATADCQFQISTDGFRPYIYAIDSGLSDRVDYSQVVKLYGKLEDGREARYSPGEVTDIVKTPILGNPDMARSCTSHIERQNGSLRQWCKRLTRLTYAFSKRWDNLRAALALHFAYYNFVRIHSALRVTPAMAAGVTDRAWSLEDLISTLWPHYPPVASDASRHH
jgi:transposase-like protein/IS1 family transposase